MATGGQQVRVLVLADELCDESDPIVPATREICRLLLHNGAHVWLPVLNRDEDKSFDCKAAEEIGRGFADRLHLLGFKDSHFGKDKPSKEWICKYFKQHYAETLKNIGALTHVVVFVPRTIRAIVRLSDELKDCRIVMIGIDDLTEKEEGFFSRWYEKCHAAYSLGESLYKYYQLLLQEKIPHKRLFLSSSREYFEEPINWDSLGSLDKDIRLATFIPSDIPLPMHQDSSAFRCFTEMKNCFKAIINSVRLLGRTPPEWFIYCRNKAEHETEIKKQLCDADIADYIHISESPWNVNGMVTTLRTSTICVFPEKSRCVNRIAQNAISLGLPTVVNMESGIGSTMKQAEITSDLVYKDGEKKLEYTLTPSMCNPQQLETLMKRAKEVHQQVRDSDVFINTHTEFINEFFKGCVSMPPVSPPITTVTVSSAAASGRRRSRKLQERLWKRRIELKDAGVQTIKSTAEYVWVTTNSHDSVRTIMDTIRDILAQKYLRFVKIKVTDIHFVLECTCCSYGVGSPVLCGCSFSKGNQAICSGTGGGFFRLETTIGDSPKSQIAIATCKHVVDCSKDCRGTAQNGLKDWVFIKDDFGGMKLAGTEYIHGSKYDIAFVPLRDEEQKSIHQVDVFQLSPKMLPLNYNTELCEGDLINDKNVQKFGCTTKRTHGKIIAVELESAVDLNASNNSLQAGTADVYDFDCPGATGGVAQDENDDDDYTDEEQDGDESSMDREHDFANDQRHIFHMVGNSCDFSRPGDSGSLVTTIPNDGDTTIKVLGMVYAGDPTRKPKTTTAFRLDKALQEFETQNLHISCLKVDEYKASISACKSSEICEGYKASLVCKTSGSPRHKRMVSQCSYSCKAE